MSSAGVSAIRQHLQDGDLDAAQAAIDTLVGMLPGAEADIADFRAEIADRQATAAAAAAALALPRSPGSGRPHCRRRSGPAAAFEVLRDSPIEAIAERASQATTQLRDRREQVEGALAAVNRLMENDLVAARDALAEPVPPSPAGACRDSTALEKRVRDALAAAETAWNRSAHR